ncbi:MAG: PAS domain-containing protein [Anaerolineae bacterium]|nr:PAS domain-containing protein [Anaerolineae bacterium]
MALQFVPASILYILSAVVAFTLAFITWRLKPEHGRSWFMVMVCAGIWATANALETFPTDLDTKFNIITTLPYLGVCGLIFFWSLFAISYSQHESWLNRYTIALLAFMPATTYLMALTSHWHRFFWDSYWLVEHDGLFFIDTAFGPWFWLWAVYAYLVILVGALMIITAVIRSPRLYQGQAVMLILGSLIPLISNFLFLTGINPIAPLDISPLALTLSGIFFTVGMLRFGLFSIVPVAHDLVVKNVNSGVIVVDLKGRIIEINPAAAKILNRSRNELVGQDALVALPEYVTQMQQFQDTWEVKTEMALGARIYELEITPLVNRNGKRAGRIILLYDMTERKQALQERDSLIKELDAYAHTVAHDLKNPLSLVVGYSNLMLRKEKETLSASAQSSLQTIAKTGHKMAEIVDALLLLASVRSMEKVEMKPLDTAVLVHNAWNRLTNSNDVAAELSAPENWPTAVGYAPWVEQVWVNYLSNAIKYGGQPPTIVVGAEVLTETGNGARPYLRFWVRDNGKGLSAAEADQLFQQFTRLDQHTAVQGHGLGLSIVQRIVERLGGTVGVESEPGVGSTFYFTLPAADTAVLQPEPAVIRNP